jgi:uncharacterized protein YqeY
VAHRVLVTDKLAEAGLTLLKAEPGLEVVVDTKLDAAALKAGERERVGALRLLVSELQKAHKDAAGSEADEVAVLQRERKRRLESAAAYRDGGRADLAGKEEAEATLIEVYLPEQLGDAELRALVEDAVAASGASSPGEMGKVMGLVMPKVKGRADGKRVSQVVREVLAP